MGKPILLVALFLCLGLFLPHKIAQAGLIVCEGCCASASDCAVHATYNACPYGSEGLTYYSCQNKNQFGEKGKCILGCGVCTICNDYPPGDCEVAYINNCNSTTPTPTPVNTYNYTTCPSGTSLSCGSAAEAATQNKTDCLYKITCNKYFWASSIGNGCGAQSPITASCSWNCSCCSTGSSRVCTQGANYTKNITIDLTNGDSVANEAAKVTCNTHDDILRTDRTPNPVLIRNYTTAWGDHLQDWRLFCRVNTCSCVAPTNTPTPVQSLAPTPTDAAPTPTGVQVGTIRARAVEVNSADTSCTAIRAVLTTDGQVSGTTLGFTPSSASQPPAQAQVGANYVTFANLVTGSYTLDPNPPTADWAFARACGRNVTTSTKLDGFGG